MYKPIIGLITTPMQNSSHNPAFGVNEPYARSIASAGGLPVLIPLNLSDDDLNVLIQRMDGILFTGGGDVDPQAYGNKPHKLVKGVNTTRDHLEIYLAKAAMDTGKPFLGICRGIQVINVALGGSLYEDLLEQHRGSLQHDNHKLPRDYLAHIVTIEPDSQLSRILGSKETSVNSLHHQGVHRLAHGLRATAFAPDSLVEAFELPNHPFGLAVQWHPEELQEHTAMRQLFQAFVQACQAANSIAIT